ncbi:hypothetical protein [Jiella avicenniae]|uniref:Oxidoreductase molybdopterin-binding domain-containing protein n=1 Tax=Jiella avicenniae TaxID=2907202 RepID=A0A9X1T3R9_9HYPH|nr:hypothetical protein [Jiella avicenniae]MCE7026560.1 hypothetical protein [Jiella avicenniae]
MAITRRDLLGAGAFAAVSLRNVRFAAAETGLDDPAAAVLSVTRRGERLAAFSRNDLAAMPQSRIATRTPWTEAVTRYEGPSVEHLLARFPSSSEPLRLLALNDYLVTADARMLIEGRAILSIREEGVFMPVSSKGPVFLMFPFDADPCLQSQQYYSRAVWQLVAIGLS